MTVNSVSHHGDDTNPFLIPRISLTREICMLTTLVCTQLLVLACLSQGIFPDVAIGKTFGTDGSPASLWGPAAYGLTSGAFMLPAGRLGDMYGHKRCYIIAWIWLTLSSLLTGISVYTHSFVFYAFCRGLQGMAAAMLIPCALAILGLVYRKGPRKNLAFSLFAAGSPTGFTVGGLFSGLIEGVSWWPWAFWATSLACCCLAAVASFTVPDLSPKEEETSNAKSGGRTTSLWHDFDWAGTATGVSGLILFNVAWNQAPAEGWSAPSSIVTVVIGFLLLATFPFVERRAEKPLIPVDRLSSESTFVLIIVGSCFASFGIITFYLVNFIIRLRGVSSLITAVQYIPVPFAGLAASCLNSFLLSRGVQPADILSFSCIWFIVGNVLLATMPVDQSFWLQAFWVNVLAPLGIDLSFPSATLLMSQLVPAEEQGIAASLIATVVYYSQSIGLGIAGTVETNVRNARSDGVGGGKAALLRGYRGAFDTGIGLSSLGLLVSVWPVVKLRLRRRRHTEGGKKPSGVDACRH